MRIISGEAKGRPLFAPSGAQTRPTSDKIRGALFNIIGARVMDSRVLDLFGGSGALALEALSRGAAEAVLIDMDRDACAAIKKNMETTRLGDKCRLIPRDYKQALDGLAREGKPLALLFGVPLFINCGFPHCLADAFYYLTVPVAYTGAHLAELAVLYPCLVIGNFVGCNLYRFMKLD
jgi:16S rRNA (guanine(966)-N(2))-methyltransferase RsmD